MIRHSRGDCPDRYILLVDGVSMEFVPTPSGIKVSRHTFHMSLELTRIARGLWSICLQSLTPRRKHFY